MRRTLVCNTSLLLCAIVAVAASTASAQNFSGLLNTQLTPASSVEDSVGDLLGQLIGGSTRGALERVTVIEDSERRLVVEVAYRDLDGLRLAGEVRGADGRTQREVRVTPVTLGPGSATASLAFDLATGLPEGATLTSDSLRLQVIGNRGAAVLSRIYALPKRWQTEVRPENVVVRIAPAPLGDAAKLSATDPRIVPPRKVILPKELVSQAVLKPEARVLTPGNKARVADRSIVERPETRREPAPAPPPPAQPASPPKQNTAVLKKTDAVVMQLPAARLATLSQFKYGIKDEDKKLEAQGPGANAVNLLENLRAAEDAQLTQTNILRIFPDVYQDRNPNSGVFYYRPAAYHLEWTPDDSYGMRMLYSGAAADGAAGEVLMAARLNAGVDTGAESLARSLLQAYQKRHGVVVNHLRPLPIDTADVSLSVGLKAYNIPAEKISIVALSDVLGQIDVSWITDTTTKDFMQVALREDVGINGAVTFKPSGGGLAPPQVPVRILLADPGTFGDLRWRRSERWRNETPYPVRLRYLHVLLLENDEPIVYSWDLGNTEVAPHAQVEWDHSRVPSWLDGRALRSWVDYSVVAACSPCDDRVITSLTGGVTSRSASQITFRTLTPLADTGAYEISVTVRSKYFDPRGTEMQQKPPVILNADNTDFTTGPIYAPDVDPTASTPEPVFEYFLEVTMPDGASHRAVKWLPATGLRLVIGRSQIEQALGKLPSRQPERP